MNPQYRIGFIGAGRVARTLAPLLATAGANIAAISSRNTEAAIALAATIDRCIAYRDAQDVVNACDLIFLTVPDHAIEEVCACLAWQPSHEVVHCSGATEISALAKAADAGARVGGFHPLQIFSDPVLARKNLAGSFVALEADSTLAGHLEKLAEMLDLRVLSLAPGGRTAYHLAANLAASCLLAVLEEARSAWKAGGLPEDMALQALRPLIQGTLETAMHVGLPGAVSGPIARGDATVLTRHLAEARKFQRGDSFYLELLNRLLRLRRESKILPPELEEALEKAINAK